MEWKNWNKSVMLDRKEELHYKLVDRVLDKMGKEIKIATKKDNVEFKNGSLYMREFEISNDVAGGNANSSLLTIKEDGNGLDWYMIIEKKGKTTAWLKHKYGINDGVKLGEGDLISEQEIAEFIENLIIKNNIELFR